MYKKTKHFLIIGISGALFMPILTSAETGIADSVESLGSTLERVVGFMQTLLFALASIFIIIAGYKYMTAGGDPSNIEDAKKMLAYTVIAVVLGVIATGVVPLIEAILVVPIEN